MPDGNFLGADGSDLRLVQHFAILQIQHRKFLSHHGAAALGAQLIKLGFQGLVFILRLLQIQLGLLQICLYHQILLHLYLQRGQICL